MSNATPWCAFSASAARAAILWLAVAASPTHAHAKSKTPFVAPSIDDFREAIASRTGSQRSFSEHVEQITQKLVGAPYVASPLGEGDGVDADPRFRLDAFDCTTFVETAMALAMSTSVAEVPEVLEFIRYSSGGPPTFATRRHLIATQWLPELVAEGLLRDATEEIGRSDTAWLTLSSSRERWTRRRIAREIELPPERIPTGIFRLPYVPIAAVSKMAHRIPSGTILELVRADVPSSPTVVTHQGIVFATAQGMVLRHASPVAQRVVDEPIERILRRYAKPRKWPILGVNLLAMVEPKARPPKQP